MRYPIIVACLSVALPALGTHNRGGEIRYEHLSGFTYRIEVVHYTKLSAPASRPELPVDFGDGTRDTVPIASHSDHPSGPPGCGDMRMSVYTATHTYPGSGEYTIRYDDQNRNAGIVNIPNSVSQSFCVSALLVIDPALGPNNSARFENSQLESGYVWSTLVHDPRPVDPDGDSLSFELVTPLGLNCMPIAGYREPSSPPPGWAWLDPAQGVYHWHLPNMIGEHTIAIRASEWRNGRLIGQVTRDMQLCIAPMPTAIAEHTNGAMRLFPTVTDDAIHLVLPGTLPMDLEAIDAGGRVVGAWRAMPGTSVLSFGHLPPGAYALRARDGTVLRFFRR